MFFDGMYGLGDNIYQRAVLRALTEITYLKTPWPQLYADLPNIRCVRPATRLRTQSTNLMRGWRWATPPASLAPRKANYVGRPGTVLEGLCAAYGVSLPAVTFDVPSFGNYGGVGGNEPYVVIRPATIRQEWRADGRNPLPEYLDAAACAAVAFGYKVISIADLKWPHEWIDGAPPYADVRFHNGELNVEQCLELVSGAAAVIGGVGWLVPAAIAARVPMLLLYGGWGLPNGPHRILDARLDTSRIHQVMPDRFCMCKDPFHTCDKTVSDIGAQIDQFFARISHKKPASVAA